MSTLGEPRVADNEGKLTLASASKVTEPTEVVADCPVTVVVNTIFTVRLPRPDVEVPRETETSLLVTSDTEPKADVPAKADDRDWETSI